MIFNVPDIVAINLIIINIITAENDNIENNLATLQDYEDLGEHTIVTDSELFPYVVAILKKTTYMSAGALIDDSWVITAADSLFLVRETSRTIRIRLGSTNHKKGGILMPIKYFHIHPYFDDNKPQFDIALIRLPKPVRFTPNLNPIRLQTRSRAVATTHFIVTGWQTSSKVQNSEENHPEESMEAIKRRRLLSVSHLHPTYPEECSEQLSISGLNQSKTLMCLDSPAGTDPCERVAGAPVVLNGVLWGIVSSWKPEDCDVDSGPIFVILVAADNITSWIQAIIQEQNWTPKPSLIDVLNQLDKIKLLI